MAQRMYTIWNFPVRFRQNPKSLIWYLLCFTLYLSVFILYYQPFYLHQLDFTELRLMAIQLTVFATLIVAMSHYIAISFFTHDIMKWNVGKEMIWIFAHFVLIAIYNIILVNQSSALAGISTGEVVLATILVGVIPTTVDFVYRFKRGTTIKTEEVPSNILYVKSEGNYIHVFSQRGNEVTREMLRSSLSSFHKQYSHSLVRVHKSFLVNMDVICGVHGNSNGGKLHLNYDLDVPYSRGFYKNVQLLAS